MQIPFSKYHGAGNDFIIIDERETLYISNPGDSRELIAWLCDRHFGIGADGLMLLRKEPGVDFRMIYFNSNGLESTMCGNGGRCLVAFARHIGIINKKTRFMASDGIHNAEILAENDNLATVSLQMIDVNTVKSTTTNDYFLDTGSPHLVRFTENIADLDIVKYGREARYSNEFAPNGTNVNFAHIINDEILIRTYERGVEDETLACGTGITATAIAAWHSGLLTTSPPFRVKALGGELMVDLQKGENGTYHNIFLQGPAVKVFTGFTHTNLKR